ncbi:vacuolar protein sorting-associated protein 37B isoform X2 [Physeter macrocephalus]|nr:vacuolar protein sorting-associated protein 37B isoform X2 [Physeter catodon]|eukprot:XP_028336496.1 vacuolar protein sorting-associated protein 37B isoform X2 [Physeter catodon]
MTLASNRSLAEGNLLYQPQLDSLKARLTQKYQELQVLFEAYQIKKTKLDKQSSSASLETLLALLQAEGAKIEEDTEWLLGSLQPNLQSTPAGGAGLDRVTRDSLLPPRGRSAHGTSREDRCLTSAGLRTGPGEINNQAQPPTVGGTVTTVKVRFIASLTLDHEEILHAKQIELASCAPLQTEVSSFQPGLPLPRRRWGARGERVHPSLRAAPCPRRILILVSGLFLAELERPAGGLETSQGWGGKGRNEAAGKGEGPERGFQGRGSQTRGKKNRKQERHRRFQQEQAPGGWQPRACPPSQARVSLSSALTVTDALERGPRRKGRYPQPT